MKKTVVELFAGVGGFRVGLNNVKLVNNQTVEEDNWKFVWANQWEPSTSNQHAFDCYVHRFGNSDSHTNIDISLYPANKIPDHTLLVGGFPCQDYSVARTLSGEKGIEGKKGVLFWEIIRIIDGKETPFILLENVDRLLKSPSKQRGRDFGIMLRALHDRKYNVEWRVINAADYGCNQRRRRVFIFAWKQKLSYDNKLINYTYDEILVTKGLFAKAFPVNIEENYNKREIHIANDDFNDLIDISNQFKFQFENAGVMLNGSIYTEKLSPQTITPSNLRDILEVGNDLSKYYLSKSQIEKFQYLKGTKKVPRVRPNGEPYFYSEGAMAFPDDLDSPSRTMLTSESSINRSTHVVKDLESNVLRFITPVEAERLQGFPDNWTNTGMTEKRRYFMMGNALVTTLIAKLNPFLSSIVDDEQ